MGVRGFRRLLEAARVRHGERSRAPEHSRGMLLDRVVRALEASDGRYNVHFEILNAAGFRGNATRRAFPLSPENALSSNICHRDTSHSDLPIEPSALGGVMPYPACMPETDYQRDRRKDSFAVLNHNCKRLMKLRLSRIEYLGEGETKRAIPDSLQSGGRDSKYLRLHSNRPSPTLTAHLGKDSSDFIHPWLPRPITVREAARLQSFDDCYKSCGSQVQQLTQVGNAVPPLLARAIAESLRESLRDHKFRGAVRVILSLHGTSSLWLSARELGSDSYAESVGASKKRTLLHLGNQADPLDELIFIILTLKTDYRGFSQVWKSLKARFPTWNRILHAPMRQLIAVLKPAGLSRQKGVRIKKILRRIGRERGVLSLDFLRDFSDADAEAYLKSFPGVGTKAARCVLMYSLGRSVFPVGSHILRIFKRLGLAARRLDRKKAHDPLQSLVPHNLRYSLHVNCIVHGRRAKPLNLSAQSAACGVFAHPRGHLSQNRQSNRQL